MESRESKYDEIEWMGIHQNAKKKNLKGTENGQ